MSTALSFALVLTLTAQATSPRAALDAAPAGVPLPDLPGVENEPPHRSPEGRLLERNGALADRFSAPDQNVRYTFEARAGELSLFELPTVGYARGWSAAARLRVLDSEGAVLAEQVLAGGVEFRPLLPFTAPRAGTFTLEVAAQREYFRYQLVRHSNYQARDPEVALPLDGRERLHGWLANGDDRVRLRVPVRAGEELVLRVEGTREKARKQRHSARSARYDVDSGAGAQMAEKTMRSMARGAAPVFPDVRLELASNAGVLVQGESFARLVPASDGELEFSVVGDGSPQAALFDLVVLLEPSRVPVAGLVIDPDDEPLAGCRVIFLLEPELDPWADTTTDAEGRYQVEIPTGNWRVRLEASDGSTRILRAGITGAVQEQVLLY